MIYWIKRKKWQIKNVFRWLPIIWKQFDFDYGYTLEVFKFQLQKQAEFLESDKAYSTSAKQDAMRIRTVLKLMTKVYNEDYAIEYQETLTQMYGQNVLDFKIEPIGKENYSALKNVLDFKIEPIGKENYSSLKFEYESWDNAKEIEEIKNELFLMSQEKQARAHKILWALIEKDIRGWWD